MQHDNMLPQVLTYYGWPNFRPIRHILHSQVQSSDVRVLSDITWVDPTTSCSGASPYLATAAKPCNSVLQTNNGRGTLQLYETFFTNY